MQVQLRAELNDYACRRCLFSCCLTSDYCLYAHRVKRLVKLAASLWAEHPNDDGFSGREHRHLHRSGPSVSHFRTWVGTIGIAPVAVEVSIA